MRPLIWACQSFLFLLKIRALGSKKESLSITEIASSFSYYPWQWLLKLEKQHLHVCFSWCDVFCDMFADQAMAEFIIFFSLLREHAIHGSSATINNSTIIVDKGVVSFFLP